MAGKSTGNVESLITQATQRFGKLSDYEMRVLRASAGDDCIVCQATEFASGYGVPPLADDPAKADTWTKEREVRAALIRWLCVVPDASKNIAPGGIQVRGAKVIDPLDLSAASVPFLITFLECRLYKIDLRYATISYLNLGGSFIESLNADGAEIRAMLSLNHHFSAREVRLVGAKIGGSLDCEKGTIRTLGTALDANRLEVKGDVLMNGFSTDGTVEMRGAQIGGSLGCDNGKFADVDLQRVVIKGGIFWRGVLRCTSLDLSGASVGSLSDEAGSWEKTDQYRLDGFVYEHIIGAGAATDAKTRRQWLARQKEFAPQPYRQLAKVFREMGYDDSAKQVLFELEGRIRAEERKRLLEVQHNLVRWGLNTIEDASSRAIIGYGIHPGWALLESAGLAGLGWIIFRRANRIGAMIPTDKDALAAFRKGQKLQQYQPFTPLIYSIENCVPLVKLGQDERWQPDPDFKRAVREAPPKSKRLARRVLGRTERALVKVLTLTPAKLRWIRWIMIGTGWLLATFFVAGLSGLIKAY